MIINFSIENQSIQRSDNEKTAANSKGFLYAGFTFGVGWEGLIKKAVFEKNKKAYSVLITDGRCLVPEEVLGEGGFFVSVMGIDAEKSIRATTKALLVMVEKGPSLEQENAKAPTPTEREQILTIASNAQKTAQSVRDDADAGKFNGAAGKDGKSFEIFKTKDELDGYPGKVTADSVIFLWGGDDTNYNMVQLRKHGIYTGGIDNNRIVNIELIVLSGEIDEEEIGRIVESYLKENPPLTEEEDPTVPSHVKSITQEDIEKWDNKSDFDGKYSSLKDKPVIPTVPTNISAFNNDSGYLKDTQLPEAINTALAEAKASGEFDGYTPIKGMDYWTETDKAEIKSYVDDVIEGIEAELSEL